MCHAAYPNASFLLQILFTFKMIASLLLSLCVYGHASISPPVASSAYAAFVVRVPHGCNGTSTLEVSVDIPKGVTAVKPRRVSGWRIRMDSRPMDTPITVEGSTVDTEVSKVTWGEGNLPDNEFEDFPLSVKLPLPVAEGTRFYFPTTQRCIQGWNNWTQIPTVAERLPYPAAFLTFFSNGTMAKFNATWAQQQLASMKSSATSFDLSALVSLLVFLL